MQVKPYRKLKPTDLRDAPIWEWVTEEAHEQATNDEVDARLQPAPYLRVPRSQFGQFIVSASIALKEGQVLPGIAEVTVADGKVAVRASEVFLIDRQLKIPSVETNRLLTRYTKTVENFPTGFTLDVQIEGEDAKRTVPIHGADMKNMVAAATDVMHWLKSLRGKGDA